VRRQQSGRSVTRLASRHRAVILSDIIIYETLKLLKINYLTRKVDVLFNFPSKPHCTCISTYGKTMYKYVQRRKVNRENIPRIKDCNGRLNIVSIEMANSLNSYYVSVFGCQRNIPQIQPAHSSKPFTINNKRLGSD
jgi:hypothetical protein